MANPTGIRAIGMTEGHKNRTLSHATTTMNESVTIIMMTGTVVALILEIGASRGESELESHNHHTAIVSLTDKTVVTIRIALHRRDRLSSNKRHHTTETTTVSTAELGLL